MLRVQMMDFLAIAVHEISNIRCCLRRVLSVCAAPRCAAPR